MHQVTCRSNRFPHLNSILPGPHSAISTATQFIYSWLGTAKTRVGLGINLVCTARSQRPKNHQSCGQLRYRRSSHKAISGLGRCRVAGISASLPVAQTMETEPARLTKQPQPFSLLRGPSRVSSRTWGCDGSGCRPTENMLFVAVPRVGTGAQLDDQTTSRTRLLGCF
jgi:hypothetical protein